MTVLDSVRRAKTPARISKGKEQLASSLKLENIEKWEAAAGRPKSFLLLDRILNVSALLYENS